MTARRPDAPEFVSLDGAMEDPGWTFRFSDEDREKFRFDELAGPTPSCRLLC